MTDRKKVIKGMECCLHMLTDSGESHCGECPYNDLIMNHVCDNPVYCIKDYVRDALKLLKEPEARVLTKDEIISWSGYVWKEFRRFKPMKGILIDHGLERVPYEGDFATKDYRWEHYNTLWRIWCALPDDEQRKAAKWDADGA